MKKVLIFLISLVFVLIPFFSVKAGAILYLDSAKQDFEIGEEFSVAIKVNTSGSAINTIKTTLHFPSDKLAVIEISKQDSIFSMWPEEPKFSNEFGRITFTGGLPRPGFNGDNGQIISIKFKARSRGVINLKFENSIALADDGKGTDIFSYAQEGIYNLNVLAPVIFSSTHPKSTEVYSSNSPEVSWELLDNISDVSFVLDKNPKSDPGLISEGRIRAKKYNDLSDGVWYFHLKAKDSYGWSLTRHFYIHIDTIPPDLFEIIVNNEGDSTNPRPVLHFKSNDAGSDIAYYRINFETGDSVILANPVVNQYQLPLQRPGIYSIVVQAFDRAGNIRENVTAVVVKPIKEPNITVWPKAYVSGEERLYLEGESLPDTEITIFLEKDDNVFRSWKTYADGQGEWSFSTSDLFRAGIYNLFSKARDSRGAVSNPSTKQQVEILFSGLALGNILLTFRSLASIFGIILFILIVFALYFARRTLTTRKILKRETKEAEESLHKGFDELRKDIRKELEKLEGIKPKRELDEKEAEILKNLEESLKEVESYIGKEIKDIDKELKMD